MEKFSKHDGIAVPLPRTNVNTDDIIPARHLKSILRTGFGEFLFANWRYIEGGHAADPAFVLNRPEFAGASILVAGENFGCGSSREHATWALREYGFRCVIAPSFADIFYNNCFNSDILPIKLDEAEVDELVKILETDAPPRLHIDLSADTVTAGSGVTYRFDLEPFRKSAVLAGLDNIGWSLSHQDEIKAYEERRSREAPWLFPDRPAE
ncbi:3-isopropylmalate dehydratase small subunit [Streptomyces sp. NPDC059918]|uniref:3-isopropylmalate dehydratase small subunit n=1 Tax=unclassified Streptomyces TaxID=2593676 RepID=UPI0036558CCE